MKKKNNHKAVESTKNEGAMPVPRPLAETNLLTEQKAKLISNKDESNFNDSNELVDWITELKQKKNEAKQIARNEKLFSFTEKYAYAQDAICNFIANYPEKLNNADGYYSFTVTKEGAETLGIGDCTDCRADFWKNMTTYASKPEAKIIETTIKQNEKTVKILQMAQPIIVTLTKANVKNSKNSFVTNLKRGTEEASQITYDMITFHFLQTLFSDVVEEGTNFVKIPQCLFAKIKSYINKNKENLLTDEEKKFFGYDEKEKNFKKRNPLSSLEIYKAMMYLAKCDPFDYNSNNNKKTWRIDLIDFLSCVSPRNLRTITTEIEEKKVEDFAIRDKEEIEKLCVIWSRIFNDLSNNNLTTGMKFTNCEISSDITTKKLQIQVKRPKEENEK